MPIAATLRKANYRFHTWAGFICAWFLIVVGMTGAVLVFEEEISAALHPGFHQVQTSGAEAPLEKVEKTIREKFPQHQLTGFRLPPATGETIHASLLRDGTFSIAYVNPSDAGILGVESPQWKRIVLKIHNELMLGDRGAAFLFFIACCMALLGTSGLWMQRNMLKNLFLRPRFSRSPRLGFTDLHKIIGIPAYIFLLVLGTTGALYNWPAFGKIAAGNAEPPGFRTTKRTHQPAAISPDAAVATAKAMITDLSPTYVSFPRNGDGKIRVFGSLPGQSFFGNFASSVDIGADSGEALAAKDVRVLPWAEKWRSFIRPLHYGNFGGIPVKIIYSLFSLALVALSITGLFIRKTRAARHSNR